jgi:hypothetical protein
LRVGVLSSAPAPSACAARHCGVGSAACAVRAGGDFGRAFKGRWHLTALAGGRQRQSTGRVLHGTGVLRLAEGPRVPCCRAQARTCPVPRAAMSARRASCGSRPRRGAAPRRPPRARPRGRLSSGPTPHPRGAAPTGLGETLRSLMPTRSAPATLTHNCCAPPPSPPVRRTGRMCGSLYIYSQICIGR